MQNIIDEMQKVTEETLNKAFNTENWHYRDITWMRQDFWEKFLEILGESEYRVIIASKRNDWPDGPFIRGQFMISPQGMVNIQNYIKESI